MSENTNKPTVMVSGCFDLLHSGHVAFMEEAADIGRLIVCPGADKTVMDLKGRPPVNTQHERAYLIKSLKCVDEVHVGSGSGLLDFLPELERLQPDIFFVNADGDSALKREAVEARGVEYRVAERVPKGNFVARSTTSLRTVHVVPYRLDLAGGWLDQPYVSQLCPGSVVNISLEPTQDFNNRSGMATSSRETAIRLWGPKLPVDDREKLAQMIFAVENPPGTQEVAGSQDPIGIIYPGVKRIDYSGAYWPEHIETVLDEDVLQFLEANLRMVPLGPRKPGLDLLTTKNITKENAQRLSESAAALWDATLARDEVAFGKAMTASFEAQVALYPAMVDDDIMAQFAKHKQNALGYKLSGAGGGGYVVVFGDKPIDEDEIRLKIRRED